jgi:hypothetical protein
MTGTKVASVAAVVALALVAVLLAVRPAQAADPSPPYLSSSSPGGYPLYGYHEDTNVAAGRCWAGLQYRWSSGYQYRLWFKCQGIPSRTLNVTIDNVSFNAWGFATYRAGVTSASSTGPIYRVGGWHRIYAGEDASVSARITTRYAGSGTGRTESVCSYRIKARYPYPSAGPAC